MHAEGKARAHARPGRRGVAIGQAFGPTLLWALHALFLLSPPAQEPTEARESSPSPLPPPPPFLEQNMVPVNKELLTGTVPVNNLFIFIN